MAPIPSHGFVRVIWREGTWWCEWGMVHGSPVLRLHDGDKVELEHEIMPGTIAETAEVMRQSVLRCLSGAAEALAGNTSHRGDTKVIGPGRGVFTLCRQCGSLRAYLRARRAVRDWYFCPDCTHQWEVPAGS
jgi:hypothetical protein